MSRLAAFLPEGHRIEEYKGYHFAMVETGDCDPAYRMLDYVARRFELSLEQRYWLAYLYSTCYSGATAFFMYNEFPDFENVDVGRLERWWNKHRSDLVFQTDRRWVRSRNLFVPMFVSYREWVERGGGTQHLRWSSFASKDPREAYRVAFHSASEIEGVGRFTLFLLLEAVHVLTGFKMTPNGMDLKDAKSSCNGLCFALGRDNWIRGDLRLSARVYSHLDAALDELVEALKNERPDLRSDIWNVETTLCAYKKFKLGKRYIGYYIDRERKEIETMAARVKSGVCWDVLWDYRAETHPPDLVFQVKGRTA